MNINLFFIVPTLFLEGIKRYVGLFPTNRLSSDLSPCSAFLAFPA